MEIKCAKMNKMGDRELSIHINTQFKGNRI